MCVLGVNGSGKSTLLNILSGLHDYTAGSITVGGLDLRQIDPVDVRRNIGYLPQDVGLFSGTLRDNLTMGASDYNENRLIEAVTFSGLDRAIKTHPKGLDLEIADGGGGLSAGQRQAVGLARLYLQNPKVVLLDEPTASLDQNAEGDLIAKLDKWLKNRTTIMTTHRMGVLKLVDNIAVMKDGAIAMHGPRDTVINTLKAGKGAEDVNAKAAS